MALKTATKTDTNRVELVVEVDADSFEAAVSKAYKKNIGKNEYSRFPQGEGAPFLRGEDLWQRRVL